MIPEENLIPPNNPVVQPDDINSDDETSDNPYEIGGEIQDSPSSTQKLASYLVTLYVVVDEEGILGDIENIGTLDKDILSQVEILDVDTTTVTIGCLNQPSIEEGEVTGQISLMHF